MNWGTLGEPLEEHLDPPEDWDEDDDEEEGLDVEIGTGHDGKSYLVSGRDRGRDGLLLCGIRGGKIPPARLEKNKSKVGGFMFGFKKKATKLAMMIAGFNDTLTKQEMENAELENRARQAAAQYATLLTASQEIQNTVEFLANDAGLSRICGIDFVKLGKEYAEKTTGRKQDHLTRFERTWGFIEAVKKARPK